MAGIVYSRALPAPIAGWVAALGAVRIVAEREIAGFVFQKEVIVLETGRRRSIDARDVFEGGNILAFVPPKRGGQLLLFPEPAA